ncbi:MAG: outer membrane protein [Fusobacteriaceae bacterium]
MKKILLGLLALTSISFAKEITPAPIVQEEVKPIVAPHKYYNVYLRAGGDVYSQFNRIDVERVALGGKSSEGMGYDLALELTKSTLNHALEVGLGVAYQNHSSFKSKRGEFFEDSKTFRYDSDLDSFDSVPVYLTAKYNFLNFDNGVVPYIKGDAGYSFNMSNSGSVFLDNGQRFDTDVENGGYFGLGAGVEYNNFLMDLMYKLNTGKIESDEADFSESLRNYRVTLSVGYKFNF